MAKTLSKSQPLPRTLTEAVRYFASPDNCLSYLVSKRWPDGVTCPTCGSRKLHFDRTRMGWRCVEKHANRRFTLKTGTIFEDSPLGLDKWLPCVWMIASMKNGVSSHEIGRALGVTQKTAWFMLHRIRLAMQSFDGGKLSGRVEVDETYIGGKARHTTKWVSAKPLKGRATGLAGKAVVMGLLERHGDDRTHSTIRTVVVKSNKRDDLVPNVTTHVEKGTTVYTDALRSYNTLGTDYVHHVVDHAEKYVDGEVHTNGCENFWSLLKRAIKGTYVSVEPFHLFRYLDEQAFRFNQRKLTDAERFGLAITGIVGRRLTYADLIGSLSPSN